MSGNEAADRASGSEPERRRSARAADGADVPASAAPSITPETTGRCGRDVLAQHRADDDGMALSAP